MGDPGMSMMGLSIMEEPGKAGMGGVRPDIEMGGRDMAGSEMGPGREIFEEMRAAGKKIMAKAASGDWSSVVEILKEDTTSSFAVMPDMNSSKDNLLHMAASEGQIDVVEELLSLMEEISILHQGNDTGNTALHLAAAMGHKDVCKCIVDKDPSLTVARNMNGETPIFVAALTGNMEVFFYLMDWSNPNCMRRNDGDTILHCTISGEYFDMASVIINKYRNLVYCRNERGDTPLHLLANNQSAFRSGSEFGIFSSLIYDCIKVSVKSNLNGYEDQGQENRKREKLVDIGQTNAILIFFRFLVSLLTFIFPIIDLPKYIKGVMKKKEKHSWACKVMKQLLENVQDWGEYSDSSSGMDPSKYLTEWREEIDPSAPPTLGGGRPSSEQFVSQNRGNPPIMTDYKQESEIYPNNTEKSESQPQPQPVLYVTPRTNSVMHFDTMRPSSTDGTSGGKLESPFLIAVKKGVEEIVEEIYTAFPTAIHDMDSDQKNVLLLAAEHRQPEIYMFLLKVLKKRNDTWFARVDKEGNTVLHLAAKLQQNQPLFILGAALQMQREIQWFKFVKESMPHHPFSKRQNHSGQTAMDVFIETHRDLAVQRAKWLSTTSQSCSVVSTLITTVAFATTATVPGGVNQTSGKPVLQDETGFHAFTTSSVAALCFSSTSLIMFLSILTSPYQDLDFGNDLPRKVIYGLATLFISIMAMFASFFAGYLFVLDRKLRYVVFPVFIATSCLALTSFPLYFEFIKNTIGIATTPRRSYKQKLSF